MKKIYIYIILLFSTVVSRAQTPLDTAPDFAAKDIHGVMRYLYPVLDSNNFVLLDFFTTTCGPCVLYAPEIQQAYQHFGSGQANVRFFGINYADNNEGVAYFDSLYGIEFPTISGINGHGNTVALETFQVQSFPTMVFIAPNHMILNHQIFPPGFHNLDSTLTASMGVYAGLNHYEGSQNGLSVQLIYPNPATDWATVVVRLAEPADVGCSVWSLTGDCVAVKKTEHLNRGTNSLQLPLSTLQPGIYFVKIQGNNLTVFQKLIVK